MRVLSKSQMQAMMLWVKSGAATRLMKGQRLELESVFLLPLFSFVPLVGVVDELPEIGPFRQRLEELDAQMAEPGFYANQRRAAEITREHQKLQKVVADHEAHDRVALELAQAAALARDAGADPAMRELAVAELSDL